MRKLGSYAVLAIGCLSATISMAAEQADATQIIDRAMAARGGEAYLTAHPAATWKERGTYYGNGEHRAYRGDFALQFPRAAPANPRAYRGDFALQLPGNYRMTVEGISPAGKFTIANTDAEVWVESNGKVSSFTGKEIAHTHDEMYSAWVESLVPLKDPTNRFRLMRIDDARVDGRPVTGVRVTRDSGRDIDLYFDKQTGLLAMKRERIQKPGRDDQEIEQQTIIKEYQQIDGRNQPKQIVLLREGRLFVETEISDMKLLEKLDDAMFAKPRHSGGR